MNLKIVRSMRSAAKSWRSWNGSEAVNLFRPHPEERAPERLSKDARVLRFSKDEGWRHGTDSRPSFETRQKALLRM